MFSNQLKLLLSLLFFLLSANYLQAGTTKAGQNCKRTDQCINAHSCCPTKKNKDRKVCMKQNSLGQCPNLSVGKKEGPCTNNDQCYRYRSKKGFFCCGEEGAKVCSKKNNEGKCPAASTSTTSNTTVEAPEPSNSSSSTPKVDAEEDEEEDKKEDHDLETLDKEEEPTDDTAEDVDTEEETPAEPSANEKNLTDENTSKEVKAIAAAGIAAEQIDDLGKTFAKKDSDKAIAEGVSKSTAKATAAAAEATKIIQEKGGDKTSKGIRAGVAALKGAIATTKIAYESAQKAKAAKKKENAAKAKAAKNNSVRTGGPCIRTAQCLKKLKLTCRSKRKLVEVTLSKNSV